MKLDIGKHAPCWLEFKFKWIHQFTLIFFLAAFLRLYSHRDLSLATVWLSGWQLASRLFFFLSLASWTDTALVTWGISGPLRTKLAGQMWELCVVFHIKDWFLQSCWMTHIWPVWTHQTDIQYIPRRNTQMKTCLLQKTHQSLIEMCFSSFAFQVCDWIPVTQSGSSLAYIRVILPPFVMSEKARS